MCTRLVYLGNNGMLKSSEIKAVTTSSYSRVTSVDYTAPAFASGTIATYSL